MALAAVLAEKGLPPWEQARLTPWQKWTLYLGVERDNNGNVKIPDVEVKAPERELTLSEEMAQLDILAKTLADAGMPLPAGELERLQDELRKKFDGGSGNT